MTSNEKIQKKGLNFINPKIEIKGPFSGVILFSPDVMI